MNRRRPLNLLFVGTILFVFAGLRTNPSLAQAGASQEQSEAVWILPLRHFTHPVPTSDPDAARFEYSNMGGRWHAMAGNQFVLVGVKGPWLRAALCLSGAIELINLSDSQPVPWQSWRALLGLNTFWALPFLDEHIPGSHFQLELGYFHESDHATELASYTLSYGADQALDNANFSSFEHLKLRLGWSQTLLADRLRLSAALGFRYFPSPLNPGSIRALRLGASAEARAGVRLTNKLLVWTSLYYESVLNDFEPARLGLQHLQAGESLQTIVFELGIDWSPSGLIVLTPFFAYSDSHGRGIDFIERRQLAGGGVRALF